MIGNSTIGRTIGFGCLAFVIHLVAEWAVSQSVPGIIVPQGFVVTKVAGNELATNVFCMAVSPDGETFVSGPGYIKVLNDSDGDGIFDSARQYSDQPLSGAQGICLHGNELLCTADGALLRFADENHDGIADGRPDRIFPIKTGGEHDAHAIRMGPDGWWYLLAGNGTPILPDYYAGPHSPVTKPRAGFLMRISPDWTEKEIFAHGFRNAYDFDFNSSGQVFVYDSDGERDISLPWYRPTRLFKLRAGDDAGWVSAGWKRPSYYLDMPTEVGDLGRGSPTGVVVGRSLSFPGEFDDAIFVADWTFGRISVFRRDSKTGRYDRGEDFAVANGQFGFAVTDLDFAPDGSLLASVGGRGTQGSIYRIQYTGDVTRNREPRKFPSFPLAAKSERLAGETLIDRLMDPNEDIQLAALAALVGRDDVVGSGTRMGDSLSQRLRNALSELLTTSQPKTLGLVLKVLEGVDPVLLQSMETDSLPVASQMMMKMLVLPQSETEMVASLSELVLALRHPDSDPLLLARIGQLALGGCGAKNSDQMFMGYTAKTPIDIPVANQDLIANQLAISLKAVGSQSVDGKTTDQELEEIGRLAAMIGLSSGDLQYAMVERLLSPDSSVQQDIHWLNCLSEIIDDRKNQLDESLKLNVARSLVGVCEKLERGKQKTDRNFGPRMKTLTNRLCRRAGVEFSLMVATQLSGTDDQIFLFDSLIGVAKDAAITQFVNKVRSDPDNATARQLAVIATHPGGEHAPLLRRFAARPELQDVVIASLADFPIENDRKLFLAGLRSANFNTVRNSAIGLRRIFDFARADEIVAVYDALRRLPWEKPSVSVRDQLMSFLQVATGERFGYVAKRSGIAQKEVVDRWKDLIQERYPKRFASLNGIQRESEWLERMATIDWKLGDPTNGERVYRVLQCAQCHDAGSRLGPRLEGIAKRFSREDVFRAIIRPNDQVPDRYRVVVVETVDGQLYQGSIVYDSVDGVTLQQIDGSTVRINRSDIEARSISQKSLMPESLLNSATDQEWSDLFAFLNQL